MVEPLLVLWQLFVAGYPCHTHALDNDCSAILHKTRYWQRSFLKLSRDSNIALQTSNKISYRSLRW